MQNLSNKVKKMIIMHFGVDINCYLLRVMYLPTVCVSSKEMDSTWPCTETSKFSWFVSLVGISSSWFVFLVGIASL